MRFITKISLLALLVSFFSVSVSFLFDSPKVSAALLYQGPCESKEGHHTLNLRYTEDGVIYDCVKNIQPGDTFAGGTNCPYGAPGWETIYGMECIWYDKISLRKTHKLSVDCEAENLDRTNCGIVRYLLIIINGLSATVGVVIVSMIIIGGIQYASAGDDPQKIQEAKKKISNAILALVIFIFMYAFLQWVVPGGIF